MLSLILTGRVALGVARGFNCGTHSFSMHHTTGQVSRGLCTSQAPSSSSTEPVPLSEASFHQIADRALDELNELAGHLEETHLEDLDVSLSQGVLTLALGQPYGKSWVINKQTPNRQIWWSSPLSGPRRYDWGGNNTTDTAIYSKEWRFSRDASQDLYSNLVTELKQVTGVDVTK